MTPHMFTSDHMALRAACDEGVALCTLVNIDGTFSRRRGAQLAITPDGKKIGSLSDGCLESQLASDAALARHEGHARLHRYGKGSPLIDFRLPCGSGVDVLIDPAPDRSAIKSTVEQLDRRRPASIDLPMPEDADASFLRRRDYIPALNILLLGEGPEYDRFLSLAEAAGVGVKALSKNDGMALGQAPRELSSDPWTAILLLFHDHEWEREILRWALATDAFYIGAQGGRQAREQRHQALVDMGFASDQIARVISPIGLIPKTRDPEILALSALSEIVARYEPLHPHGSKGAE